MVTIKTYLTIMFNSEGALPSEVKDSLLNMGFEATIGNYDFVYDWPNNITEVDVLVFFAERHIL